MKANLLYEGKGKKVFMTENRRGTLVLSYKDEATAFNGKKKANFTGKGRLNNEISAHIFSRLQKQEIETHFIKKLNETEQLVHQTEIIPLEVVIRNMAAGSITKRLGMREQTVFQPPLVEFYYKNDQLGDPLINDDHARLLCHISDSEIAEIKEKALQINQQLIHIFAGIDVKLVDFKLEFGRLPDGSIILADEISPDTCRLWDRHTNKNLDKDVFRQGTGDLLEVYQEIYQRLEARS
ncbi:phosphoribosylaminoimidazolesuccinocarboxamide synthase [Lederbergia sp. NSJ-179]|uniref:phosphoribosylaminoimidazolesuccinocarboxamide synthase n=1 Tax=Lederbergia sp. NSJ-179 TaxID=2931402 RepID=UPI001FCF9C4F|nr:phosphoribosylaminoimidazolesuccinocarboxamide synthase [Lederbergia sp. NSJ-179]MCJ7841001.1 phosphoribosylaminoimidazolesuccinocarboxamide synthase [Lederbergia sp. NSJ-179]